MVLDNLNNVHSMDLKLLTRSVIDVTSKESADIPYEFTEELLRDRVWVGLGTGLRIEVGCVRGED